MLSALDSVPSWLVWFLASAFPLTILAYQGYRLRKLRKKGSIRRVRKSRLNILFCLIILYTLVIIYAASKEVLPEPVNTAVQSADQDQSGQSE